MQTLQIFNIDIQKAINVKSPNKLCLFHVSQP